MTTSRIIILILFFEVDHTSSWHLYLSSFYYEILAEYFGVITITTQEESGA